ncbi:efflux RND transporter permease subunit [Pontibacter sp. E15-1]|uniref:efflux RND transporter permease subunit n=1 Tax=Pontibacter sp. E15-1 TaxID=2919918 RepID=UPI001F4F2BF4|nr:efflux RND transporter permease subunit [Pontibacter sp. E15-1]MCJ8163449.1 efflux RND transporter permease subunit [Pontibacter sp. E15-1]
MSITDVAVKRPTLVVVIFSILVLLGLIGYSTLTYELLPKISSPVITITTIYPGAAPSEVETAVSKRIESAVSTLENLESTQAISQEGVSVVVATLLYGTDVDVALQEAQRKVNSIKSTLPDDVDDPSLGKFSFDEMPIMRIGATSDMDERAFTTLFEKTVQPELARIEGVAQVNIIGGENREIKINVDNDKLRYYNLSILQVSNAISRANLNFPTGSLKSTQQDVLVRLSGKFTSVDELANLVVATNTDGSQVYLKDVAELYDTKEEASSLTRINGRTSLGILITKTSDGNTVGISDDVKEAMAELEQRYSAEDMQFTIANDSADFTLEAANSVIFDLIIAIILVAFIMLFFLHNIRNALIVMVAIPVSIVATFAVMALLGFSLNLMTLLALSLVVGILVDDSIVVLENIHMYMEQGKSAMQAAMDTWKEIGISVTSITLVIIVVFLPITFVSGVVSDLLFQFSITVVAATIISWLVSFTLTPWLSSRFTKLSHLSNDRMLDKPLIWFESMINGFQSFFKTILLWALHHKRVSFAAIIALVIASFTLIGGGFIGVEFVANGDNGEFQLKAELPKETPLEQTNFLTQQIEEKLLNDPNVVNVFTTVGASGGGSVSAGSSPYIAELNVKLVPAEQRTLSSSEYAAKTKLALQESLPGAKFTAAPVSMVGGAGAAPIQFQVQGANLDTILAFSEKLIATVKTVSGTSEVKASVEGGNPEIAVQIDRQRLAELGLSLDVVGTTMQNAFTGNDQSKLLQGDDEYPIRVQLDAFDRRNINDIRNLTFQNDKGELIKLNQFASIVSSSGPSKLERKDKIPTVTVESQVVGRPVGTVGQEIQALIDEMNLPEGVNISAAGDLKNQTEAFSSLLLALMASIVLVYLIMVALYDNYVYPLVVMLAVPVAMIGAFLALALTLSNLSIFGMLGLIMLVGLVIKNAILIVDFVNQLKAEGMPSYEALVQGTMARFRPILMTTIAMVIAMIPIAIATGAGAEWKNGLAWVLIGGLTSSMLLTLIIVPVAYLAVDVMKERRAAKKERKAEKKLAFPNA